MNSTKIEQMPCAFEPNLIVTPDTWALSFVQKAPGQGRIESEHANLVLQLCRNDKIEVMKLHAMGYKPKEMWDHLTTNPCLALSAVYVHVEIVTNEARKVAIIDEESLHTAIKAVLGVKPNDYSKKNLQIHFVNATWLIPKEKGLELIDRVQKQVVEFEKTRPVFNIAGKNSVIETALYHTKTIAIEWGKGAAFAAGTVGAGNAITLAFPMLAVSTVSAIVSVPAMALFSVYMFRRLSQMEIEGKNEGNFHSCFTWAKERVLELDISEINNDKRMQTCPTDYIASVTSRHLTLAHNNIHQGNERI